MIFEGQGQGKKREEKQPEHRKGNGRATSRAFSIMHTSMPRSALSCECFSKTYFLEAEISLSLF